MPLKCHSARVGRLPGAGRRAQFLGRDQVGQAPSGKEVVDVLGHLKRHPAEQRSGGRGHAITIPLVLLVLIFQRRIVSGLTAGAVK